MIFHHVGYVVASIEKSAASFAVSMNLEWSGRVIHDPLQTVRVSFLTPRDPGNPVVELVEPEDGRSTVASFLKRGGGLHHLCYEVDSLDRALACARGNGDLIARPPAPAAAFDGRRIAWVYTRTRMLLEFLER